jgi:acetyl esterase/lipase
MSRFVLTILFLSSVTCYAQKEIPLFNGKIPNTKSVPNEETIVNGVARNVTIPTLSVFLPENGTSNGTSVIICPGGGYGVLVIDREGYQIAKALNKRGITAFVLKYRLPDDKSSEDKSIVSLQDAQQAIKTVRERANEWKIDPQKIGIMGFSAGGHLASTAGTHFEDSFIDNKPGTDLRPDFMILVYPVISFLEAQGHKGSRANLIGTSPATEKIKYFSSELQVKSNTPPAFLTHAGDDTVVPVSNSILFYEALHKNKISADLHIYSKGEHGYPKTPAFEVWFGECLNWMKTNNFVP